MLLASVIGGIKDEDVYRCLKPTIKSNLKIVNITIGNGPPTAHFYHDHNCYLAVNMVPTNNVKTVLIHLNDWDENQP